MSSPLRIGLIGVGNWALAGHVPALTRAGATVHGIASRDPARAAENAAKLAAPIAAADWRELIAHPDVDALVVTTPPWAHVAPVTAAIEAGKPVLCESPLAPTAAEARKLADLARERGVITGYTRPRPFNFNGRALCDAVQSGAIGTLRRASFELSGHPWLKAPLDKAWIVRTDSGPNPLAGLTIGLAVEILGPISEVSGSLTCSHDDPDRIADQLVGHLRTESGVVASLHAGFSATPRMEVTLYGDAGALRWDLAQGGRIENATSEGWQPHQLPSPESFAAPAAFVEAIRSNTPATLDFDRAARELALVESIPAV